MKYKLFYICPDYFAVPIKKEKEFEKWMDNVKIENWCYEPLPPDYSIMIENIFCNFTFENPDIK